MLPALYIFVVIVNIAENKGHPAQKETEYKERLMGSPIYTLARELEEYNNRHKTKYSYGQYIALVKAKDKKKCKKVKKNT